VGVLSKHNTLLIMVNQLRTNLAAYGAPADTPGGRAIKHYASVRLEVRRSTFLDDAFKEQRTKENAFGHVVTCFTAKNKTAIPFKKTEFNLIYGVGFDTLSDTINLAVDFNIVDKSGAWYTYNEQRYQGLANFNDMLRNNAEVYGEIQSKVFDMIKG
jgi:recombination protein RecA